MKNKNDFMAEALKEAQKAYHKGEVPVGCVIVYQNEIIARGHNLREKKQQSYAHAEMLALKKACKRLKTWRLEECDIYITLEPCPMCSGAILQSRIRSIQFGAYEQKFGACGSVFNLFQYPFNHQVLVEGGIMEMECKSLIQKFFKELRESKGV